LTDDTQYNSTCVFLCTREKSFIYLSERANVPGITKLVGIYDADGGVFGEIKYFASKLFSNHHCSLCDITHGKSKNMWQTCEKQLPIAIDFIHLNERSDVIAKYTNGATPCVIGKTATGYVTIVSKKELNQCNGDPKKFETLINQKLLNQ